MARFLEESRPLAVKRESLKLLAASWGVIYKSTHWPILFRLLEKVQEKHFLMSSSNLPQTREVGEY